MFYLPVCKPDLKLNFDNGIRDISGNNYRVVARRVRLYNGAAYFRGNSKLLVEPFRPKANDDGTFIVKLRYREDLRRRRMWGLQSLVTNGHCGRDASVVITKVPGKVFVGAEASNMTKYFYLPTTVSMICSTWSQGYKSFSCSTQLSIRSKLLINTKMHKHIKIEGL